MRYYEIQENINIPSYVDLKRYTNYKNKNTPVWFDRDHADDMGHDSRSSKHYYNSVVKDIKRRFDSNGYIFLYRTLTLRKNERVNIKNIGIHWSTEIINKDTTTHLLSGKVHYSDINWYSTLLHRFSYPHESEITLRTTAKIEDLKIEANKPSIKSTPVTASWPDYKAVPGFDKN